MLKNKKVLIGCAIAVAIALIAVAGYVIHIRRSASQSGVAYVSKVTDIGGIIIGGGAANRYPGVVESLDTWKINKDPSSTVKDIFVNVGDTVYVGTPLFTYDAEEFSSQLMQAEIDLERMNNEHDSIVKTISQLEKDRRNASSSERSYITIQIQEQELAKKQSELDIQAQQQKITKIKDNIQNASVVSEVEGVVKSISNGDDNNMNYNGDNAFITIIRNGEMRVKSQINEQNIGEIVEGDAVIVHSRVDSSITWNGTISKIDYEATQNNNNMYMYGYSDGMTSSSSYNFYIDLESSDGMMIGQHVYVEKDSGLSERNDGLWIEEYLIAREDNGNAFIWADNGRGRLEKRHIGLGEYDDELMCYRITSGLKEDDLIAVPDPSYVEGMRTASMDEMAFNGMSNGMDPDIAGNEDFANYGEGMNSGEGPADGMYGLDGEPDRDIGDFENGIVGDGGDDGSPVMDGDAMADVQDAQDAGAAQGAEGGQDAPDAAAEAAAADSGLDAGPGGAVQDGREADGNVAEGAQ
jgi:HlyD family secretion protein